MEQVEPYKWQDDWDGYEHGYMLVSLCVDGEEHSPFIQAVCDKFHLNRENGVITLWKNIKGFETVVFKGDFYDSYSLDFLYEETKSLN